MLLRSKRFSAICISVRLANLLSSARETIQNALQISQEWALRPGACKPHNMQAYLHSMWEVETTCVDRRFPRYSDVECNCAVYRNVFQNISIRWIPSVGQWEYHWGLRVSEPWRGSKICRSRRRIACCTFHREIGYFTTIFRETLTFFKLWIFVYRSIHAHKLIL